jgi:hypothetical protein
VPGNAEAAVRFTGAGADASPPSAASTRDAYSSARPSLIQRSVNSRVLNQACEASWTIVVSSSSSLIVIWSVALS